MEDILIPLAGMATGLILLLPLVRVSVRLIERRLMGGGSSEDLAALRDEIRSLQQRVDDAEHTGERVAELEERLDFAERILARQREAPQIERPE